jgi:beta-lactamase superfamily II metal-dependent hydrolase
MPIHEFLTTDNSAATIAFLDVGQGDANVIVLPDKRSGIVIDCCREEITRNYLDSNGITTLEYVFLSHTDQDHLRGIVTLLEHFSQTNTTFLFNYDTTQGITQRSRRKRLLRQVAQLGRQGRLSIENPRAGHKWTVQDVQIECLYPTDADLTYALALAESKKQTNNASIVLLVTFAGKRVLFTGDLEAEGWTWLVGRGVDLKANVLKFPHHGAWYEASVGQPTLADMMQKISPEFVVISVGTGNTYGHPRTETLQLLSTFPQLRFVCTQATKHCHPPLASQNDCPCAGTIEVVISKNSITITPDVEAHTKTIELYGTPQCRKR